MDPKIWLVASFLVFVSFVFLKLRKLIVSLFVKYKTGVLEQIKKAEDLKSKSKADLEEVKNQAKTFKEMVEKIKSSSNLEIEKLEAEMKKSVSEYIVFKERNFASKVEIFKLEELRKLKSDIFNLSLEAIKAYYKNESKHEKIDLTPLTSIKQDA